jgi:fucose permease
MEQSVALFIQSIWIAPGAPDTLKAASRLNSIFLVVVGITAVLVQGFLVRRLLKSYAEKVMIRIGLAALSASFVLIPVLGISKIFPLFLVSASTLALGIGLFNPAMTGLIARSSEEGKSGLTLALNQSAAALGRITGPTFAGALFAASAPLPFALAALMSGLALAVVSQAWPEHTA